eukprot:9017039-Ditylum_brightwellii.AAC.1
MVLMIVLTIVLAIVMTRSKQNKRVVGDKYNDVDDSVGNSDDGADKHLTHLSQVVDCYSMERSKQNKRVVGDKDNSVDDS